MEKKNQWNTGYWIVAILLLSTLQNYWRPAAAEKLAVLEETSNSIHHGALP